MALGPAGIALLPGRDLFEPVLHSTMPLDHPGNPHAWLPPFTLSPGERHEKAGP